MESEDGALRPRTFGPRRQRLLHVLAEVAPVELIDHFMIKSGTVEKLDNDKQCLAPISGRSSMGRNCEKWILRKYM